MKKNIIHLLSMLTIAALLTPLATACSSDELDPPFSLSTPKGASKVHVSVGAGISGDATRSAVDYTSGVRTLQFTAGDKLYVYAPTTNTGSFNNFIAGYLTVKDGSISADGTSASFEGDLYYYEWDQNEYRYKYASLSSFSTASDPLAECVTANVKAQLIHDGTESYFEYETYSGNPNFLSNGHYSYSDELLSTSVEDFMSKRLIVTAHGYDATNHRFDLAAEDYNAANALFNCTINGLPANKSYSVSISRGSATHSGYLTQTDANGIAQFVVPYFEYSTSAGTYTFTLKNTADATDTYSFDVGPVTLQKKIYNICRHWTGTSFSRGTDLSTIHTDYTAADGEILTGKLKSTVHINIADGATVIFSSFSNTGLLSCPGITCEGDANIVLSGTNTISSDMHGGDGIIVPAGKTLTISGSGSLMVSCNNYSAAISGGNIIINGGDITTTGCIGAGNNGTCGDITISGGTVTATGTYLGPGIGCGQYGQCGNITISGGTVNATGDYYAAGIGSGLYGQCGDITITSGVTHVTATKGSYAPASIGAGMGGTCGAITIGDASKVTMN